MWQVLIVLVVGSCYTSGEQFKLTIVPQPAAPVPTVGAGAVPGGTGAAAGGAGAAAGGTGTAAGGAVASDARIIGGTPAPIESYPYAVQVLHSNQLACGGTLVTVRHVMSAAHCFVDNRGVLYAASRFTIRVGSATINTGGSTHRVSRIINHEQYNMFSARANDISVLLLASAVTLSARVGVAQLYQQGHRVPDNSPLIVVGWGTTNMNVNQASPVLNHVGVFSINTTLCAARYFELQQIRNEPFPVTDSMMCSGILNYGGRDACQGDSGGPVIYAGGVVGVTSWGEECAHYYYPGVNVRVSAYTTWVNTTVSRNTAAPSLGHTSAFILLLSFLISIAFSNKL